MNNIGEVLARLGIEAVKPTMEEAVKMAESVGEDMTPEDALKYYRELKNYQRVKTVCQNCKGFASCGNAEHGHKGYSAKLLRSTYHVSLAYYECQKSRDAQQTRRLEKIMSSSMVPENLKKMSFKDYDPSGNEGAVSAAKALVKSKTCPGIIFSGRPGVGKTHLAMAIINNRMILGNEAVYTTAPQLFQALGSSYSEQKHEELMETLCSVELLMLDDLGVEKLSDSRMEDLFVIVNSRTSQGKQFVVTTNLDHVELVDRYGSRIASRLIAACEWYEIKGSDRRMAGRNMK